WAGRGLKPRWLAAALKAGHKIEAFLIGGAPKVATAKAPKGQKRRKAAPAKSSKPRKVGARKAKAARTVAAPRKGRASKPTTQPEASGGWRPLSTRGSGVVRGAFTSRKRRNGRNQSRLPSPARSWAIPATA